MKTFLSFLFVSAAVLLPLATFAANDGKGKKRPVPSAPTPALPEALVPYDKNGNHQIDPEELAAVQQVFSEMRKLDKNGNGEIETSELAPPKPASGAGDRVARAMAGLKKVDKNANGKIDDDEIESLQKMLAGGRILQRLDQNGNGKLEPSEVERLNQHMSQMGLGRGKSFGNAKPGATKPSSNAAPAEEKKPQETSPEVKPEVRKAESPKKESDKFDPTKDPFVPGAEGKPSGNSAN